MNNHEWYTYRQAAKRVNRSPITIKRWRRNGMPMSWDAHGQRIVKHETLLQWLRETIQRDNRNRKHQQNAPTTATDLLN